ncbi:MAG: hypothetical protein R6U44_00655 [Archaeoglobaceae archaeon]
MNKTTEYEIKQAFNMLIDLKKVIQREKWLNVFLWQSRGAYVHYDLCNLKDVKWDYLATVCRKNFKDGYLKVYDLLKEFEVSAEQFYKNLLKVSY